MTSNEGKKMITLLTEQKNIWQQLIRPIYTEECMTTITIYLAQQTLLAKPHKLTEYYFYSRKNWKYSYLGKVL